MSAAPFVAAGWLKLSDDQQEDMVRPFYDDYAAVCAQIMATGQYPYNDSFRGRIPGIDPATTGTSEKDEETAIYLLQKMRERIGMRANVAAFIANGGRKITAEDLREGQMLRGTVARYGWYSGGTGWQQIEDVRVLTTGGKHPRLVALPKGKRTNGYALDGGSVLFREGAKA